MASIKEVCESAEKLAQKYNPEGITPFPFEKVLQDYPDLAIGYSEKLGSNVSGAIGGREDKFIILINNTKPPRRQYFTIAHEIGHYFLHKDLIKTEEVLIDEEGAVDGENMLYRLDDALANQIEREANNFGASLIMPAGLVRAVWEKTKDIAQCAELFGVSVVAMSVRLNRLGLVS